MLVSISKCGGWLRMKLLECPYCHKEAARLWEIFVFPSPFWQLKICEHCKKKIRFNSKTIYEIVLFMISGIVLGNILIRVFSIRSVIFEAFFLVLFICFPVFLGRKLFSEHNNLQPGPDESKQQEPRVPPL